MNLVKAQELLKGMPIPELQKYANGFSPEMIPPWLAMGEMNAKMEQQKKMAAMQGAAGGPQPSVKEQIEQKAGLMALQAQQQAQAQQQMTQQAQNAPMPAPAGVPQPQGQPQAQAQPEQPAMMASGGLAGAPIRFNFDGGGIVAFADGGKATDELKSLQEARERYIRAGSDTSAIDQAIAHLESKTAAADATMRPVMQDDPRLRTVYQSEPGGGTYTLANGAVPTIDNVINELTGDFAVRPPGKSDKVFAKEIAENGVPRHTGTSVSQATESAYKPRRAPEGLPAAVAGATPPSAAPPKAPQPRPPGLPGAMAPRPPAASPGPAQGSAEQMALQAVKEQRTAMTPEAAMGQEQQFAANYGLNKPQDTEQRGLLAAMKQRNEQYMAGRPMAELGATLRGFSEGHGGAGAASARAQQETYNTDMANQREQLNAIDALSKRNQELNKSRYTSAGSLFGEDRKATDAFNKERMQTLGSMSGAEKQERASKYTADVHMAAARLQAAAREQGMDDKQIQAAEAAYARDPEAASLRKLLENPIIANNPEKAADKLRRLQEIQASKYAQYGLKIAAAPGAASPGGTSTSGWGKASVVK